MYNQTPQKSLVYIVGSKYVDLYVDNPWTLSSAYYLAIIT